MNRALLLGGLRWPLLIAGVLLCLGGAYLGREEIRRDAHEHFRGEAIDKVREIELRLRAYSDVLYALRGLLDSSPAVTRENFHQFAQALSLRDRYPGLNNISYSIRLAHADRAAFESAVRAETGPLVAGLPPFSIKPPGARDEYLVLHFVEPMGANVAAWGLDLMAEQTRRAVVERARDSGAISAASVVMLKDSHANAATTLLRLAVYRGGGAPGTVEDRQRLLQGIVGSSVRIGTLIEATLSKGSRERFRVQVMSLASGGTADAGASAALLYDSSSGLGAQRAFADYAVHARVPVGDGQWNVEVTPLLDPVATINKFSVAAGLLASLALCALLFWLTSAVATGDRRGAELGLRNREALMLTKLGAELHSCVTLDEAYVVITRRLPEMLPSTAAVLYLIAGTQAQAVARWGLPLAESAAFAPRDCRAIALRYPREVDTVSGAVNCTHFTGTPPARYTCIPFTSHGETIGMLNVQRLAAAYSSGALLAERNLIMAAAQHVALAVSNLQLREKLVERATRDNLTGLFNRHYMREWFDQELARAQRHGRSIGVIAIDADHFKRFNDDFSHAAGDSVLRELAGAIRRLARRSDVVCRLGGEEFLLLMPEATLAGTLAKAEQLRRNISTLDLRWEDQALGRVTISAGVAMFPQHADTVAGLLRVADQALYVSKQQGRDRVTLSPEPAAQSARPVAA